MLHNYFDKIYCINRDSRTDRWSECLVEFRQHEIENVNRFSAIENKDSNKGCTLSHLELIKAAKWFNLKNVLILEDDVEFVSNLNDYLEFIPEKYDMLYFGGNDIVWPSKISANLSKLRATYTTHAYAIDNSMYDTLIDLLGDCSKPIDVYYAEIHHKINAIGFRPKIAFQRESYSDIQKRNMNYKSLRNEPNPNKEW